MSFKELQEYKTKILELAFKHGVKEVKVFGSVARNEQDTNSDIDFLVEMRRGKTLLDRLAFKNELEALLGKRVDVISVKALNKKLKDSILKEAALL